MSDLTLIAEDILAAMDALEQAQDAGRDLREARDREAFEAFRTKMAELQDHLGNLLAFLQNEEAYAMDELMDALSTAYGGRRADYRRTPRMRE